MSKENIIAVAKGEKTADLLIKNANILNVFSEEIYKSDIAIQDGYIAAIGYGYKGNNEIDLNGKYLSPSFIDGHVHIESSMLLPLEFSKAVAVSGTTAVVTDPHEIANVLGLHGISFMRAASKGLPLDIYTMLPSCVPASRYESSGFELNSYDLALLIDKPWVLGMAEMMDFPSVLNLDKNVMAKIQLALEKGKRVDGHAPSLSGKNLNAYVAAGITSDHECTTVEEAIEKLRLGMYIMVREGSSAKDLDSLLPFLTSYNTRKCMFVTDDRHPQDLKNHINDMVRKCVKAGLNPIKAVQMASLNTAEYFKLSETGAIAPGYKADILVFDDLIDFKPSIVFKNGEIIAKNGILVKEPQSYEIPHIRGSVNVKWIEKEDFKIKAESDIVNTIKIIPKQLITKCSEGIVNLIDGYAESNIEDDILKVIVIERHRASGNIGKGFVNGFGLKNGALASTVAHDSHNMIVVGTNDADMYKAAVELVKSQGGKVVVKDEKVLAKLELPIAGLMSNKELDFVITKSEELDYAANEIGCNLENPFMAMSFLSLSVIPELKITDQGVLDVINSEFIDIFK